MLVDLVVLAAVALAKVVDDLAVLATVVLVIAVLALALTFVVAVDE